MRPATDSSARSLRRCRSIRRESSCSLERAWDWATGSGVCDWVCDGEQEECAPSTAARIARGSTAWRNGSEMKQIDKRAMQFKSTCQVFSGFH